MWYVVMDAKEGPFLTQDKPRSKKAKLYESSNQSEAETYLLRAVQDWEADLECDDDGDDGMNESFR